MFTVVPAGKSASITVTESPGPGATVADGYAGGAVLGGGGGGSVATGPPDGPGPALGMTGAASGADDADTGSPPNGETVAVGAPDVVLDPPKAVPVVAAPGAEVAVEPVVPVAPRPAAALPSAVTRSPSASAAGRVASSGLSSPKTTSRPTTRASAPNPATRPRASTNAVRRRERPTVRPGVEAACGRLPRRLRVTK